jgi:polysaccharide pyruvyl transferase WcaK-like protein
MKRVVLWGGWYGSRNVGDQALLITIIDLLRDAAGDLEFHVLTDDPEHVNAYARAATGARIRAWHNRRQLPRIAGLVSHADLLVFGGGVPFFDELKHLIVMLGLTTVARAGGTPYMTWAVSSQSVRRRFAKLVFRWVLNGARAITYRDQHTHDLFRTCGIQREMHLVADSGFLLKSESEGHARDIIQHAAGGVRPSRPLLALTPRHLRGADGEAETHYSPKRPWQIQHQIECYAAALDWAWDQGYLPIFVPMNSRAPDDDRIAANRIAATAANGEKALLIDEAVLPSSAPAIYGLCDFSLTSRVHGSIAAMIGGSPMAMYAFDPKHEGIMAAMNMERYCIHDTDPPVKRTLAALAELEERRQALKRRMTQRLKELRDQARIPARLATEILSSDS